MKKALDAKNDVEIKEQTQLRPEVAKRIERAIAEAEAGKNISPAFKTAEEAIAWLNK